MTDVPRYLQIGHREGDSSGWTATIITTEKQTIQRLPVVESYAEAVERAVQHSTPLRITEDLIAEMTAAGVGPATSGG